jgi:hypothetical protein
MIALERHNNEHPFTKSEVNLGIAQRIIGGIPALYRSMLVHLSTVKLPLETAAT